MTPGTKRMLIGSFAVAGLVGIASVVDIFAGFPFAGRIMLDIMFILSAALIGYMGWDTWRELT